MTENLFFPIEFLDGVEKIAYVIHKRFIIQSEKFQNKAKGKLII